MPQAGRVAQRQDEWGRVLGWYQSTPGPLCRLHLSHCFGAEQDHSRILFCLFVFKYFFLMWTIFKVFIEFFTIFFSVLRLGFFWPQGMWDLSSPTRDQTHAPCIGR